jgi:aconitate hydratase
MLDSFGSRQVLDAGSRKYRFASLKSLEAKGFDLQRLPYSLRVLLENLLRHEDGKTVGKGDVEALLRWDPKAEPTREIQFMPGRVLLQDFTGVPAVVDFAAMRDAMAALGGDPTKINPLLPADLVIDHSIQVDAYGTPQALARNRELEFARNGERYTFLRWGQKAFRDFRVVPPETGICHQVNLEYLASVVLTREIGGETYAYPDTVIGTDSHTTMINGLGVLGWGVGGIEAEAAMLGQPVSMLIPQVVGFRLAGRLREGVTATDLVLTVTETLRRRGVVGKFVEFFGPGMASLPLADRATIGNMAPEYGATCGIFPVDAETLRYLTLSGRSVEQVALVEKYYREQGLFHEPGTREAEYTDVLELDLGTVEPSLAGPKRPQDRVRLTDMKTNFAANVGSLKKPNAPGGPVKGEIDGQPFELHDGSCVIAAITSCTNTSNPSVMLAAGLVAKKAHEKGLTTKPWVKSSLAPGSKVVADYLVAADLLESLEAMRFHLVGFGCTTCIGNSGPLPDEIKNAVDAGGLVVASVLSGNRNFEGRIHSDVRANYLASPPLVVAFAIAGRVDVDLSTEPLGVGRDGEYVYLRDVWPTQRELAEVVQRTVRSELFEKSYGDVFLGPEAWRVLPTPEGSRFAWDEKSTYVKNPPYFAGMRKEPSKIAEIGGARALLVVGDSVTTDHISPAGNIGKNVPAGRYLMSLGVEPADFNSYGARRGNHEVMMRGTFANTRIKNLLVPGVEGGVTVHFGSGEQMSIYDAAMRYQREGTPLVVIAGKEYGTGSSRDWAAKGPALLGVKVVIAESFERIHRSNLVGMGVLPLQFEPGQGATALALSGREVYSIEGLAEGVAHEFRGPGRHVKVIAVDPDNGTRREFMAIVRIDTPQEVEYYRHGGILPYVLRKLL